MKLNVAVIGAGKIGSIHHRIYNEIEDIGKVYVVDTDKNKKSLYDNFFTNYKKIPDDINLVSIASSTPTHYKIAKFFLEKKIPVLVEKPITEKSSQAKKLLEIAKENNTLIFVGHVERYNNAYLTAKNIIKDPKFIECHRLSPYPNRSLDVGVVLDLMIHDLDIILDIVKDNVKKIDATGINVLSSYEDIANVRITFEKGCIANITASRISKERVRKFRVFFKNHYISLDYANQEIEIYQKNNSNISQEKLDLHKEQPLQKEIQDFVRMVIEKRTDIKSAKNAKDALELALKIQKIINKKTQ